MTRVESESLVANLFETDPRLHAVIDKKSRRNLLDHTNPDPLSVNLTGDRSVRFAVQIVNGPEGLIELSIAADTGWLKPETERLTLVGGEKGECIISAQTGGVGEFGNLLFSWEGSKATLCQSVLVRRQHDGRKPPVPDIFDDELDLKRRIAALEKFIKGCAPDKFIDFDEEQRTFRKGGELEFEPTEVESILHRLCKEGGWTRETRLRDTLKAQLIEATKDDGVVDKVELAGAVAFAVNRKMPHKDALELCVTIMLDNNLRAAPLLPRWLWWLRWLFKRTIIDGYRKQFGI